MSVPRSDLDWPFSADNNVIENWGTKKIFGEWLERDKSPRFEFRKGIAPGLRRPVKLKNEICFLTLQRIQRNFPGGICPDWRSLFPRAQRAIPHVASFIKTNKRLDGQRPRDFNWRQTIRLYGHYAIKIWFRPHMNIDSKFHLMETFRDIDIFVLKVVACIVNITKILLMFIVIIMLVILPTFYCQWTSGAKLLPPRMKRAEWLLNFPTQGWGRFFGQAGSRRQELSIVNFPERRFWPTSE